MISSSRWLAPVAICACIAFLLLPFLRWGVPSGHDFDFHVSGWYDAAWQWRHGIAYPRNARWSDYGAGEPRFVFYPPLSWTLGAILSFIVSPRLLVAAYVAVVFALGACGTYLLARRWLDSQRAVWAAAVFVLNPYSVILVYWRSAFAEMLGMALLPWLLLVLDRAVSDGRRRDLAALAVAFAAIWIANTPSAVLITYLLALLALVRVVSTRDRRGELKVAAALALGLCMSAAYLAPAIYEQRWLDLTQVLDASLSPRNNVLFSRVGDADFLAYNHLVSKVTVSLLLALLSGLALGWRRWNSQPRRMLLTLAIAGVVLLLPPAVPLWEHLPKLRFVQFPWRYCFVLAIALALVVANLGMRARLAVFAVAWICGLAMWHPRSPIYWTGADDSTEFRDEIASLRGYEGIWDYAPANTSINTISPDDPELSVRNGSGKVISETVFRREFEIEARGRGRARIEVLDYPAWQVSLDGARVANAHDDSGRIVVPVMRGTHRIVAEWHEPRPPIVVGAAVSATALLLCAVLALRR